MSRVSWYEFALAALVAVTVAACGDDDGGTTPDTGMGDGGGDAGMGDGGDTDGGDTDGGDTDGGGDPCAGLTLCTTAGTTCDGSTLVDCAENTDGCLVETRTDCAAAATGGFCDAAAAPPMCAVDPCASVMNPCTAESRTCDADTLVVCAADAMGCLVETRTDCTATGDVCQPAADPVACGPHPCTLVPMACMTAGRSCDGTTLVDCAPDAMGCLVETRTDCGALSPAATCDDTGAMPMCVDPCMGLAQCPAGAPAAACDGDTLVTCATDASGCYLETRTDCTAAATGGTCDATGATPMCVDPCAGLTLCAAGDPAAACSGNTLVTCTTNAAGCYVRSDTACATCDSAATPPACGNPSYCPAPITVIGCGSGTVTGDTAMGTMIRTAYAPCTTSTSYAGREAIFEFQEATDQVVTITSTRGATTGDYDLFVLGGGSSGGCDDATATTCLDASRGTTATETIEWHHVGGDRDFVVYDIYNSTTATSEFTLAISCRPIVCGDGMVDGGEACDDGNTMAGDGCSPTCTVDGPLALAPVGASTAVGGVLTTSDPTYTRATDTCGSRTGAGGHYDTWLFENTSASPVTITVTAMWSGDGFLFIYTPPFDPTMPTVNCGAGDDDFGGTSGSQIAGYVVPAGGQIVVVATTFSSSSTLGPYTIDVATTM